ncbi:T-complex protein 10A homolog 1 [Pan troglodytes]|uniref:T-complex 10A-2 n=1 Tax=Pan troglodytes TaxID=9598 RepID=Q0PMD6_PANTR|nr:T-complex protein 10A homolog 1 [Pan troglodytes]ABG79940.1 T-complex 10A-2 [Pan troglodytes]
MLAGQLEARDPKEGTHPEDPCPGAGAVTEKTAVAAEVLTEDCNAGEMPPLQQQVIRLHQELGRQKSLWADVHGKLRSHIDALREQNMELREKLRALQLQRWKARKKSAASPHAGQENRTLWHWNLLLEKCHLCQLMKRQYPNTLAARIRVPLSWDNSAPPKPMSLKIERISSWKTPPQEKRDKSLSRRRQDRRATPTGRPTPCAERRGGV